MGHVTGWSRRASGRTEDPEPEPPPADALGLEARPQASRSAPALERATAVTPDLRRNSLRVIAPGAGRRAFGCRMRLVASFLMGSPGLPSEKFEWRFKRPYSMGPGTVQP